VKFIFEEIIFRNIVENSLMIFNRFISIRKNSIQSLILGLLTVLNIPNLQAQNPQFRQLYAQRHLTNPALVGLGSVNSEAASRITSGTKAQWLGISNRLYTQTLSFDSPVKKNNTSWGVSAFTTDLNSGADKMSKYSHFSASLTYAYDIKINAYQLKLGLTTQFSSFSFGKDQFLWEDQINQANTGFVNPTSEPLNKITRNAVHVSAGALFYGKKGFLGFSAYNINQPDISFYGDGVQNLPLNLSIQGGTKIYTSPTGTEIIPSFNYLIQQQTVLGKQESVHSRSIMFNAKRSNFRLGLGAQNTQAFDRQAWSINYYFGARYDKYYFAYSNDWNVSLKNTGVPVTHEFSLIIFPYTTGPNRKYNPFPEM
jgi:type IX secretion system PorP/SprF family membrane protein